MSVGPRGGGGAARAHPYRRRTSGGARRRRPVGGRAPRARAQRRASTRRLPRGRPPVRAVPVHVRPPADAPCTGPDGERSILVKGAPEAVLARCADRPRCGARRGGRPARHAACASSRSPARPSAGRARRRRRRGARPGAARPRRAAGPDATRRAGRHRALPASRDPRRHDHRRPPGDCGGDRAEVGLLGGRQPSSSGARLPADDAELAALLRRRPPSSPASPRSRSCASRRRCRRPATSSP